MPSLNQDSGVTALVDRLENDGRTAAVGLRDNQPVGVLARGKRRAVLRLTLEVGIADVRAGYVPQNKVAAVRT
ncbi:hypothetical protein GCM10022223_32850 [Kineosporia mesophila]|uniref:Uncharacterized protein n=1 Tax=Kineosporia mesophila TaxID=566012 RepID=A0ABP6ZMK0_9ACTN